MSSINRKHRTALVVDIRDGVDNEFRERVARLQQSVNGDNIKADLYTLSDAGLQPGINLDHNAGVPASDIDVELANAGYVQVLHTRNLNPKK